MAQRPAPDLLKVLDSLEGLAWEGSVWRHMFAENHPSRANDAGARWNPRGVGAIYCSLDRATALAEGDYAVSVQSLRPTVKRTLYEIHVRLGKILDLSSGPVLRDLGLDKREISKIDHTACQRIGGAAEWLEHDGILVPSARHSGLNLVIFPRNQGPDAEFEIVGSEVISRGRD